MSCSAEIDLPKAAGMLGDQKDWQATVASEILELKSSVHEILELQSKLLEGQNEIYTFMQLRTGTGTHHETGTFIQHETGTFTHHDTGTFTHNALLERTKLPEDDRAKGSGDGPRQVREGKALSKRNRLAVPLSTLVRKELKLVQRLFTNSLHEKTFLRRVVGSGIFELVVTVVVLLNTVCMGVISNCEVTEAIKNPDAHEAIASCDPLWLELSFFSFYGAELLLKLAAWRLSFFTRRDATWNMFDLVVVSTGSLSFIDTSEINLMWFRVIRIFRQLAKVLRVIRVVRFCDELRVILISVTSSMNFFFWSLVTLAIIMYICAIVMCDGVSEYLKVPAVSSEDLRIRDIAINHWGSIWLAMDTLYRSVTGGGPWGTFIEPLQKAGDFYFALFLMYIAILVIGLLRLLTGIFVQHASAASSLDRDSRIRFSLEQLFHKMDEDETGLLTLEEFQDKLDDPVTIAYFQMLQIDRVDIDELFTLTDVNDDKQIDIHEFIEGCQTYKGYAKKLDARYLRKQISNLTSMTESCLRGLQQLSSRTPHYDLLHSGVTACSM
eukprot:TRINITY_DN12420_c0_g2_i1.p1 TRINITY_DN12420_c0_g2~~TRINITY_DN12420_c0_g2_i1.p1  ORF type:complete len:552 (+),score=86.43 TRINITY_DN12420_c0_g2_i1:23-1678(+)